MEKFIDDEFSTYYPPNTKTDVSSDRTVSYFEPSTPSHLTQNNRFRPATPMPDISLEAERLNPNKEMVEPPKQRSESRTVVTPAKSVVSTSKPTNLSSSQSGKKPELTPAFSVTPVDNKILNASSSDVRKVNSNPSFSISGAHGGSLKDITTVLSSSPYRVSSIPKEGIFSDLSSDSEDP